MIVPIDDELEFAEEASPPDPAGLPADPAEPWLVLVVDDEPDVVTITRTALFGCRFQDRPLRILEAGTAAEGQALLERHPDIAVALLDVVMETDDAGLRLAVAIRETMRRHAVRLILRTGQPGRAPERDVIFRYDINDYRLKTELTAQSLVTLVVAGLRGYTEIAARQRAEAAAVLANRAKTEFLANINHELRTPLNAIIGLAELMDGEAFGPLDNETYQGFVHDIVSSGKALEETLGAILDVASLEFDNVSLEPEAVATALLLERVARPMTAQAQRAGVTLSLRLPPAESLPPIWGDARRLRQMLLNLISNAIKFNHRGGTVELSAAPAGDQQVVLSVSDNGIGMTGDQVTTALTPFRQVDGGLDRRHDGSGLGLPLAKMIAELHHGTFAITSAPGHGTTVRVTLTAATGGRTLTVAQP